MTLPLAQRSGAERVLALARKRGRVGVHSSDFDRPGETVDGGKPVRRLASRIDDLRNRGHVFETRTRADRTCDYVLVRDAEDVAAALAGIGPGRQGAHTGPAAAATDVEDLAEQLPLELDLPAPSSPGARPGLYDWDGDE